MSAGSFGRANPFLRCGLWRQNSRFIPTQRPGIGTVVAEIPEPRSGDRKRLLGREVEQLVVEAKRVDLEISEVIEAIEDQWAKLETSQEVSRR